MFERAVKPSPFVIIVDKDGDPVDILGCHSTDDVVSAIVRHNDKISPQDAPHRAFELLDTSRMVEFQ